MKNWDVAGVGNALVDALVVVEDESVLQELGLVRGTMHPVDHERWMAAYERLRHHKVAFESGGSCANTVSTVGLLGGRAIYCGQVGDDQMGHMYAKKMEDACGAHALRFTGHQATGKCLSIISSKDAERTMLTDLGAATELGEVGNFAAEIAASQVVHFEGYAMLGGGVKEAVLEAMRLAKRAGTRVSFDAADPFVISAVRDSIWEVLTDYADIAFLNADEARMLTGEEPERAIGTIANRAGIDTVVVKLGSKGSIVQRHGEVHPIAIRKVHAVDTTGAGDAYAGGFLYGWVRGWPAAECGRLASAVAALTVSQIGAVVKDREALLALLDEFRAVEARA